MMTAKDMSKVKLLAFIYDSPQTWWLTCNSIFSTYKIKNGTEKYNHLIANLRADVRQNSYTSSATPSRKQLTSTHAWIYSRQSFSSATLPPTTTASSTTRT